MTRVMLLVFRAKLCSPPRNVNSGTHHQKRQFNQYAGTTWKRCKTGRKLL